MHALQLIVIVALVLSASSARSDICATVPDGDAATRFSRPHKVPHVADGMRTIKQQDGSTIEAPAVATVTDEMVIWDKTPTSLCLSVTTYGRNGHQCEIQGTALLTARDQYLFTDKKCSIRLVQVDRDRVRLEPLGPDCKKDYCGMFGIIERATYVRR